jgi:hypothetical protein
MNPMVRRPPFLQTERLARLCRYSRRGHFWSPSRLIRQLVGRLQIHRRLRLCRRSGLIAQPGASRKSAPASGEKLGRRRSARRFGSFRKRRTITACGSVRALVRCHTLRHHNGDSLRARSIPMSPVRSPQRCRTVCRLRSGMKGRINAHSPDKRELGGINYSRAQSLDRQENRIGCERLRRPFCAGVR